MRLNLPIHSYQLRSRPASPTRLVNCYPELMPPDGHSPVLLSRSPGITAWSTVGNGEIKALHAALDELFVVSGSEFYRVDAGKNATLLGTIGTPGNIDIESNGTSVVVVNEPDAYYWDGATFGQITDPDFTSRGAGDVEFVDNFLLFREPDSDRFFGADLGTATDFDALQFANSDANPDLLIGMKADHRQLVLASPRSTEIFENTGVSGFPFQRSINGYVEQGCLNGKTLAKQDNTVFWVAEDYTVRRLDGTTPVRISTHAIEALLQAADETDMDAYSFDHDGHLFYVLRASNGTFVYDATTREWSERQTYTRSSWDWCCHAQAFGLNLLGDSRSSTVGYVDAESYTDNGTTQRMEWTYQPVYAEGQRAFHDRLEIVMETGVGLTTGQGSDPTIELEKSDDGGLTWEYLPSRSLGELGKRQHRVVWHNLGSSRDRVYRCSISDPVKVVITDSLLEVRGGRL